MLSGQFRCHPSIIVANSLRIILVAAVAIVSSLPENGMQADGTVDAEALSLTALITAVTVLAILVIYIVTRFFAWKRTFLSITTEHFIYHKRTVFFQKKVKVRLSQISAVNLQKGLVDRLFGTYTVKLDFNSSATAEKTDFHLVFKADFAKAFEAALRSAKDAAEQAGDPKNAAPVAEKLTTVFAFDTGRILLHALFMTPIWGAVAFGAALAGITLPFFELSPFLYPVVFLAGLPVAFLAAFLSSLLQNIFLYHHFTLSKSDTALVVSFGLITKRSYRLPLSKTHAVVVKQSLFGRIFGMYYAEILNVGMGSEQDKIAPVFCLMLKRKQLEQVLQETVPAFADPFRITGSPRRAFWPSFGKGGIIVLLLTGLGLSVGFGLEQPEMVLAGLPVVLVLWVLFTFAAYKAKGISVGEEKLVVATGVLNRRFLVVPYAKLQTLEIKQGPVSKALGLCSGAVSVLSTMANRNNTIGYFPPDLFLQIAEKMNR